MKKADVIVLVIIWAIVFLVGVFTIAHADEPTREHHIEEGVLTVDAIPYNECRWVKYPPRSIDRLVYPSPVRMCNTLGVVRLERVEGQRI